jgi:anti-sigma regulatory factor (Ser/Thr protein kinase)
MPARPSSAEFRDFLLRSVWEHPADIASFASERFGISRQAVNRRLRALVAEGLLEASGRTRARRYAPKPIESETVRLEVPGLQEDVVWRQVIAPHLDGIPENVKAICNYGFTEMVNNAIDHSLSPTVLVALRRYYDRLEFYVIDDGIGIFKKIKDELGLPDEQHAILEIAKGKLTTDPERHSGEGIFFTSRMFDRFSINSGKLHFGSGDARDWLLEMGDEAEGTGVFLRIDTSSPRRLGEVFDAFASEFDDYGFSRTTIPVELLQHEGERLVSRSQAKRLLVRIENFKEVILDFEGVETVGQAFADEIFRVFRMKHPDVHMTPLNMTRATRRMIERALERAEGSQQELDSQEP